MQGRGWSGGVRLIAINAISLTPGCLAWLGQLGAFKTGKDAAKRLVGQREVHGRLGGSGEFGCYTPKSTPKGGSAAMTSTYTGKYTKTESGYMGQLVEWPEVVTEGGTLEECRELLKDALQEMVAAYQQEGREIPLGGALLEQVAVET